MTYRQIAVPVSGGELAAGIWGDNPDFAILAAHGITANHTCWQPLAELLPQAMIIAPDLRGRGRSNGLAEPFGLRQHALDLEALLDGLGVSKVMVVGHSMGGFVSVRFAANHPERVTSMILVDGGLPLSKPVDVNKEDLVSATLGPAAERLAMIFPEREDYQEFWKGHPAFKDDFNQYVSAYVDYDLIQVESGFQPSGKIASVEADIRELYGAEEYLQEMRQISVPTVFLRAPKGLFNDAPLYSDELSIHHSELISNLKLVHVDDFNHYTIVLSKAGSECIAAEVQKLASFSNAKQETT